MNSYMLPPVTHDLDGLTFPTNQHEISQTKREYTLSQDFGFDPPPAEQNMLDQYPVQANKLGNWGSFNNDSMPHQSHQHLLARKTNPTHLHSLSLPQLQQQNSILPQTVMNPSISALSVGSLSLNTKTLPNTAETMSLYGQVTPPRSNSATSEPSKNGRDPASAASDQSTTKRRRGKPQVKNPLTPPEENNNPKQRKAGGRKRTGITQFHTGNPEDEKRKASLEKNRVAAAKCRINKKEKTEQLQRDSHTKAQENGQLRGLVETMEAERNTLVAYLGAHANCADCRNPQQLKEALQMFPESDIRKRIHGLVSGTGTANASPIISVSGQSIDSGLYDEIGMTSTSCVMNPPLPDFNLGDDYDMNSPLPT